VEELLAGWHDRFPKLMLFGKDWNQAASTLFPGMGFDNCCQCGNYMHFLKTLATADAPELYRVYGGMCASWAI
jgi:hypothetical protein